MRLRVLSVLAITYLILFVATSARADRRKFVWTYSYQTMPAGKTELEIYQTTRLSTTNSNELRFEIEHGLTDNWDIALYEIFNQQEGKSFNWDAWQLRSRIKLAPSGQLPLDPLLYLEYQRKIDLTKQNKLEAKLILSRDFDRVNLSINPLYEFFFAPGDPVHEIGLDAGLSFEANYQFSFGAEWVWRREFVPVDEGGVDETAAYVGPTISFAHAEVFANIGYLTGLTDDSDDSRVRFIVGIGL